MDSKTDGDRSPVDAIVTQRDFPNGLTVAELKALIADWPEIGQDGEPTEVWIETGRNRSSPVVSTVPLNKRGESADIIFESLAFKETSG